jgi:hypothetical protein
MLEFFRRYQRIFFIFVTVVIIVTFSLFGSYKAFSGNDRREEIVVGRTIDGSKLKYRDIKWLSMILGAEEGESGIIVSEFLKTKVGEQLAVAFKESLQADWVSRLERAKQRRFYVHPSSPVLNAEEVWRQTAPGAIEQLQEVRAMDTASSDFFTQWTRLFLMQQVCPADLVQRLIFFHQGQYRIAPDPYLASEDFAFLGYRSIYDWFGPNYMDIASQFILNAAIAAEARGFRVSRAEAEMDLTGRLTRKDRSVDLVLRSMGISHNDAVRLWQRTLLFLNYFHSVGQSVVLDDLSCRRFSDFTHEYAVIDAYHLPEELRFRTVDDFLQFEIYCRLACVPYDSLGAPETVRNPEEVQVYAPELIFSQYQVQCAHVDLKTLRSRLSMREIWEWQKTHWNAICQAFPEIAEKSFEELERVDLMHRSIVDDWCRARIIDSRPEWIERELELANSREQEVLIFANQDIDGLEIQDCAAFQILISRSVANDPQALEALRCYRSGDMVWRFNQIRQVSGPCVISLAEAKKKGREVSFPSRASAFAIPKSERLETFCRGEEFGDRAGVCRFAIRYSKGSGYY